MNRIKNKHRISLSRSDSETIISSLGGSSFSLELLSLGEARNSALSKHSRKAHIKNVTIELLSLVAGTTESLEVDPSLVQSWQPVSPAPAIKITQKRGSDSWLTDTGLRLRICLWPPLMCWIVNMHH